MRTAVQKIQAIRNSWFFRRRLVVAVLATLFLGILVGGGARDLFWLCFMSYLVVVVVAESSLWMGLRVIRWKSKKPNLGEVLGFVGTAAFVLFVLWLLVNTFRNWK
jgi:hypothetical protein